MKSATRPKRGGRAGSDGAERRIRTTFIPPALTMVVICALLGAVTGLALSMGRGESALAVTTLTFVPDPPLPGQQISDSPADLDRFAQTQILVLTGSDARAAVADSLGLDNELTLSAQQVGATDVVQVQVEATTSEVAMQASTALIQRYDQQRRERLTSQVSAMLNSVDAQLAGLESFAGPQSEDVTSSTSTERSRLLALRNQLALIGSSSDQFARVVDQPHTQAQGGLAEALRAIALGCLAGAVLGVALALLVQRFGST